MCLPLGQCGPTCSFGAVPCARRHQAPAANAVGRRGAILIIKCISVINYHEHQPQNPIYFLFEGVLSVCQECGVHMLQTQAGAKTRQAKGARPWHSRNFIGAARPHGAVLIVVLFGCFGRKRGVLWVFKVSLLEGVGVIGVLFASCCLFW